MSGLRWNEGKVPLHCVTTALREDVCACTSGTDPQTWQLCLPGVYRPTVSCPLHDCSRVLTAAPASRSLQSILNTVVLTKCKLDLVTHLRQRSPKVLLRTVRPVTSHGLSPPPTCSCCHSPRCPCSRGLLVVVLSGTATLPLWRPGMVFLCGARSRRISARAQAGLRHPPPPAFSHSQTLPAFPFSPKHSPPPTSYIIYLIELSAAGRLPTRVQAQAQKSRGFSLMYPRPLSPYPGSDMELSLLGRCWMNSE